MNNNSSNKLTDRKKIALRRKAKAVADVFAETGVINLTEAHRRIYPGQSPESHDKNAPRDMKGIEGELSSFLSVKDKDILKKITPEVIIQGISNGVKELEKILSASNNDGTKEISIKAMNSLREQYKLLGQFLGIWQADKPQVSPESIDDRYSKLFSNSN